jgi:hypothetical protein
MFSFAALQFGTAKLRLNRRSCTCGRDTYWAQNDVGSGYDSRRLATSPRVLRFGRVKLDKQPSRDPRSRDQAMAPVSKDDGVGAGQCRFVILCRVLLDCRWHPVALSTA